MNPELIEFYRVYRECKSLNERIVFWENPDNLKIARKYDINYENLYKAEIAKFNLHFAGDGLDGRTRNEWNEMDLSTL